MKHKGDILWGAVLLMISGLLMSPWTNPLYEALNSSHPFMIGFLKFAVLASMGELLALRLKQGKWDRVEGQLYKTLVWGIIGVTITMMFKLFPMGVQGLMDAGVLPSADGLAGKFLFAFYTSIVANVAFGPAFMMAHRVSDSTIDLYARTGKVSVGQAVDTIDWPGFIRFVIGKTIPFFWIPAHVVTFMLPPAYRILCAAYLSIALGILLAIAQKSGKKNKALA